MKFAQTLSVGMFACAALVPSPTFAAETCAVCGADQENAFVQALLDGNISGDVTGNKEALAVLCAAFEGPYNALKTTCKDCDLDLTDPANEEILTTALTGTLACDLKFPVENAATQQFCKTECYEASIKNVDVEAITCENAGDIIGSDQGSDKIVIMQCLLACPKSTLHDEDGNGANQIMDKLSTLADDTECAIFTTESYEKMEKAYHAGDSTNAATTLASTGIVCTSVAAMTTLFMGLSFQ